MSYQIELRHLRYFMAVAEELHYKKAADRLYISQPGLSRQIKQLEESIGVKLFERHSRKVQLTNAGYYLKKEVYLIFNHLEDSISHAQLLQSGLEGNLRFGYVGSAIHRVIPELLIQFETDHPEITYNLKEMDNKEQIESLMKNEIDIGFVRLDRAPKTLELYPVLNELFCLVVPNDHQLDDLNFRSLRQVKDESFILFDASYSPSYHEQVMQIFDNNGFTPKISHYTIHASSIYRLVENGLGISIVPESLTKGYDMNIKFIPLSKENQRTVLSAVWNTENRNPAIHRLIDLVKNRF